MDSMDRWCALVIILGLLTALIGSELNADARYMRQWKQAVSYGYAEQVIENDQIVFKWIIPASATAKIEVDHGK